MRLSLRSFAFVLLLVSALTGCSGMSPNTAATGDTGDWNALSPASPDREEIKLEDSKPHPGGVPAMPVELGDDPLYATEGEVEPVCRLVSGKIQFRIKGIVYRENGGSPETPSCRASGLIFRYWDGTACQSEAADLQDCRFDRFFDASEVAGLHVYRHLGLLASEGPPSIENVGPLGASSGETENQGASVLAINKTSLPGQLSGHLKEALQAPVSCQREGVEGTQNRIVVQPVPSELPPCSLPPENLTKMPLLPPPMEVPDPSKILKAPMNSFQ